jgi:hypothetical protein
VQLMVKLLLGLPALPSPHDAADALAVAICHAHSHRFARLVQGPDAKGRPTTMDGPRTKDGRGTKDGPGTKDGRRTKDQVPRTL